MAATIRKQGDDKPISVLVLAQDIEYAKSLNLFTDIVEFQPVSQFFNLCVEAFEKFGTYPKINLIHYAKYDENIFLDTDVLCQYNANDLWEFLSKREEPVAMMGHKIYPQWHWGTIHEVSAAFGKQVPHTHGGFLYFRKTDSKSVLKCKNPINLNLYFFTTLCKLKLFNVKTAILANTNFRFLLKQKCCGLSW